MTTTAPVKNIRRSNYSWKPNWDETTRHYIDWWNHTGYVIGAEWNPFPGDPSFGDVHAPVEPATIDERSTNPAFMAARIHHELGSHTYPSDFMPIGSPSLGPGSLALWLGSNPGFSRETVWYHPCVSSVEDLSELKFDPTNRWWKLTVEQIEHCKALGKGRYPVGCPDLIEGIDTLSSLVGAENMFADMKEMPELVHARLREINQVWFKSYDAIYDMIKDEAGAAAFWAFSLWGPGKTAKIQCDASSMISPDMFGEFVVPYLREQCQHLDYSMYHLDGTQCIPHLDHILSIKELDAIEWTPQLRSDIQGGGGKMWHDMYRKIKAAGKSIQVVYLSGEDVIPLFDAVGPEGMFVLPQFKTVAEAEKLISEVAKRFPR